MNEYKNWLTNYVVSIQFPSVGGFEILEMLQARSHLAQIESSLNANERAELEAANATFLAHANEYPEGLSEAVFSSGPTIKTSLEIILHSLLQRPAFVYFQTPLCVFQTHPAPTLCHTQTTCKFYTTLTK